jgi:hypothetical protein
MLWRPAYETRELSPVECPSVIARFLSGEEFSPPDQCVLLGAFDPKAQAELGVWRRLITEAIPSTPILTLFFLEDLKMEPSLRAMTPKSTWSAVALSTPSNDWIELIQPDRPERSFAGVLQDGIFQVLMVGPPTEEAWDRFLKALTGER